MRPSALVVFIPGSRMFHDVRLKQLVFNYFGFLLILVGLHQAEGTSTEMANLNWKPFVYGGMASIVAEFGELMHDDDDDDDAMRNVTVPGSFRLKAFHKVWYEKGF